jgi:secondary thiamine-phosphate synthase enzyme
MLLQIDVRSKTREEMIDITAKVRSVVHKSETTEGRVTLFVPHTTAAVTINENADPSVQKDMLLSLAKISPILHEFRHLEGNSDAHVKSSMIGCSQDILISDGELVLGTWQGIYFCEFDGPRNRRLYVQVSRC